MDIKDAIKTVKQVGLNVYTPKTKDSGFIKLYSENIANLMPKISSNALKVLIGLSTKLKWDELEVEMRIEQITKVTGLNRDAVRVALDELEKNFVIKRLGPKIRRSYMVSNYYVRIGKNK